MCIFAHDVRPSLWQSCDRHAKGKTVAETEKALDRLAQLCQRIIEAAMGLGSNHVSPPNLVQSAGDGIASPPAIPPGDALTKPE